MKPAMLNNFCRVFELPKIFSEEFCFNGGIPTTFLMVDWFNPWPVDDNFEMMDISWEKVKVMIKEMLLQKKYVKIDRIYLVITDFGESFMFIKEDNK